MKTLALIIALAVLCGCRTTYVVNVNTTGAPTTDVQQGKAVPVANGISAAVGQDTESGSPVVDLNDLLRGD